MLLKVNYAGSLISYRYSGAQSAQFSHSIVLYLIVKFLKYERFFKGSKIGPSNDSERFAILMSPLLNHNFTRYPSRYCTLFIFKISISYHFNGSILSRGKPTRHLSQRSIIPSSPAKLVFVKRISNITVTIFSLFYVFYVFYVFSLSSGETYPCAPLCNGPGYPIGTRKKQHRYRCCQSIANLKSAS